MGQMMGLITKISKRKGLAALAITCFASLILFGVPNIAHATAVVGFNPGNIMDNIVMTNADSMGVSQIQNFINSKVPVCDTNHAGFYGSSGVWYGPPFTCLKDFTENNLTAAQIIYNAAHTYNINPQVLLVLLQKEEALLTDTWPAPYQYKSATGYGCPDSTPGVCNSSYYGFTNQVNNAAKLFHSVIVSSPTWYSPYIVGNNYIQWSPNASCGGSTVYIQNRATAALYDYTPYQPNQASLNAGYGTGDNCSAYGNRNFYLYFTSWFGPTHAGLVGIPGGAYLIENGTKRAFTSAEAFYSNYYKWSDIVPTSPTELSLIPDGAAIQYNVHFRDKQLIVSPSNVTYQVENGQKRLISAEAFYSNYYNWSNFVPISAAELSLIPDGAAIQYNVHFRDKQLIVSPSGGLYLVENGTKRLFPNAEAVYSNYYNWSNLVTLSSAELSLIPDGGAIQYNVHFRDGQLVTAPSKGVYLVENGTKRPFPSTLIFLSHFYKWSNIVTLSSAEISLIPDGAVMQ
ncbi:MAG: hypothetical protein NTV39_00270 [Candidatus Saccharibacteria bacterium]|nr:hypothetical protein [Candidatus Saccharibacteria bacterium]